MSDRSSEATVAIRLSGVTKTYRLYDSRREAVSDRLGLYAAQFWRTPRQFKEFRALDGIDLTVRRGERVGIIGRNGAGKTTLLKLITRNFEPTAGEIEVNGIVQAIMQAGLGFYPDFTGLDNVRSSLLYNGLAGSDLEKAITEIRDFVELGAFFDQPVNTYSQGMLARLQFAVATAVRPHILIIDEVMGAGDAYFSSKSAERMRKLVSEQSTLLLVSHSMDQILQFSERVIWMKGGHVFAQGEARSIVAAYQAFIDDQVTSKAPNTAAPASVIKRSESSGYAKRSFLRNAILASEPINPLRQNESEEELTGGHVVYRWRGIKGLEFARLPPLQRRSQAVEGSVGKPLSLDFTVQCTESKSFNVMYSMLIYGLDGRRVARVDSPPDRFNLSTGETRQVQVSFTPVLLGPGEYLVSLGIFDMNGASEPRLTAERGYDFLSRSLQLKIEATNDSDPPVFNPPMPWLFGDSQVAQVPSVTGWI